MSGPVLAAVTLDARGGGVAAVARLLWHVCQDRWGDEARLITLLDDSQPHDSLASSKAMRLRFGARLARAQARGEFGWVFYSHVSLAQVQAFIPAGLRRPYVVFLHGIEAWRPIPRAQRAALEGASLLISNSGYTAERVAQSHPWIGPIAACPLSLPPRQRGKSSPGPGGRPSSVRPVLGPHAVLVVARMSASERYKGHDQLLEAFPTVMKQVRDAQLVFAGAGDDAPRLAAKAKRLQLGDRVIFTGFVDEPTLEFLYERAALFAMPSREEGFGVVYLEAMRHGLPCVGSTHDAARETIVDGVTGVLVRQSDVGELAAVIGRLLSDEGLRRRFGQKALERVADRFSYERFADRLASLLVGISDSLPAAAASPVST